jgi:UDP-N-acetylmuramyl pentapeptide phosphotransferase/UDP-N-acetylglucosamine-1-phosphate transferase
MVTLALLAQVAFFVAFFLIPLVRRIVGRRGWVDTPDHAQAGARKLHGLAIPRLGGS